MKENKGRNGLYLRQIIGSVPILAFCCGLSGGLRAENLSDDAVIFQPSLKAVWDQPRSTVDDAKVELGKVLYHEKRLSRNNDISCNSCHDVERFGVDGVAFSAGFEGHEVGRNSPTTFNAFGHISQFWDGRATTVEEQAKGPILAAGEMAMPDPESVVQRLKGIEGYDTMFARAFPDDSDPINYNNVGISIGAFERLMSTPARWDKYLDGDSDALSPIEKKGMKLFVQYGCSTCHNGTLVGGGMYQKAGLVKPWTNTKDLGRHDVTQKEMDKFVFKVPSLRNVEKTGPYFHDASAVTLERAIEMMAWHQVGAELKSAETQAIAAFLKTMTGDIPSELKVVPPMPDQMVSSEGSFD